MDSLRDKNNSKVNQIPKSIKQCFVFTLKKMRLDGVFYRVILKLFKMCQIMYLMTLLKETHSISIKRKVNFTFTLAILGISTIRCSPLLPSRRWLNLPSLWRWVSKYWWLFQSLNYATTSAMDSILMVPISSRMPAEGSTDVLYQ